jgi:flagellar biosynthesis/type III secretory pathway M-ring protein FliF/YscJ
VLKGLYNSANATTQNFGFTIPQAAMVLGAVVLLLLAWSMIAAMRNRKSFTLEDEDGEFSESPGGLHGGLLRP